MSPRAHLHLRIAALAVIAVAALMPRGVAQTAKAPQPVRTQLDAPATAPPAAVAQS